MLPFVLSVVACGSDATDAEDTPDTSVSDTVVGDADASDAGQDQNTPDESADTADTADAGHDTSADSEEHTVIATETVSAVDGGTIELGDSGDLIVIPAGALDEDTELVVRTIAPDALDEELTALNPIGTVYDIQPDGLVFEEPVSLVRTLPLSALSIEDEALPLIYASARSTGSELEPMDNHAEYDLDEQQVVITTSITHLSVHTAHDFRAGDGTVTLKVDFDDTDQSTRSIWYVDSTLSYAGAGTADVRWSFGTDDAVVLSGDDQTAEGDFSLNSSDAPGTARVVLECDAIGEGSAAAQIVREDGLASATTSVKQTYECVNYLFVSGDSVEEGATAEVEFNLDYAFDEAYSVQYRTEDGTATAGASDAGGDYEAQTGTVTFAAGETSKTVQIPTHADCDEKGDEDLELVPHSPSPASLRVFGMDAAGVTISDQVCTIINLEVSSSDVTTECHNIDGLVDAADGADILNGTNTLQSASADYEFENAPATDVRQDHYFMAAGEGTEAVRWADRVVDGDEYYYKLSTFSDGEPSNEANYDGTSDYLAMTADVVENVMTITTPAQPATTTDADMTVRMAWLRAEGDVNEKYTSCYDVVEFDEPLHYTDE